MMKMKLRNLSYGQMLLAISIASVACLISPRYVIADEPGIIKVTDSFPISQYIDEDKQRTEKALLAPLSAQELKSLADQNKIPALNNTSFQPVFGPANYEPRSLQYPPALEAPPVPWVPVSYQEVVEEQSGDYREPVAGTAVIAADTPLAERKVKQSLKNPTSENTTVDLSKLPEDHPVRVLMGIRSKLGSVTEGTSLETNDFAELANAIQKEVDTQKKTPQLTPYAAPNPATSPASAYGQTQTEFYPAGYYPDANKGYLSSSAGNQETIVLRKTAADLEGLANRLEEIGSYENADRLREQAHRIRLEARYGTKSTKSALPPTAPTREPARIRPSSSTRIEDAGLQANSYAETLREAKHVTHWSFPEIAKDIQARQYQQEIFRLNQQLKKLRREEF